MRLTERRDSWLAAALWLLLGALQFGCAEKTSAPVVTLEARRDFGYTVGGVVEHRVIVDLPPHASVDPQLLPGPGPVNDWLDLRSVRWSMPRDDRLQLDLAYLILKGVKTPEPTAIPPLSIGIRRDGGITQVPTPEWPFTLMPVIPPGITDEKLEIRGMRSLPSAAMRSEPWVLGGSVLGAAACAMLIALRRGLLPLLGPPPPFTAALRDIARLSAALPPTERYAASLKRIHRAIDETAGATVFPATLHQFLDRHPAYQPLRCEFEQFFRSSERHFFAVEGDRIDAAAPQGLADFCRRCARVERGPR